MADLVPESEQQYGSILTVLGESAEQNGKMLKKPVEFTHIAFGDANDTYVQPDRKAQSLVNELYRIPVNSVDVLQPTPDSVPILKVEALIPDDIHDIVIREFAAVATFNGQSYFHAVGNCARVYVPNPVNNGQLNNPVSLEMTFVITSAEPIVEMDPNVITASREWVNKNAGYKTKNPILRNIGDKLRENSSVRDMGDNKGDDTENIKALSNAGSIDDSDAHDFVIQEDYTLLSVEDDKKMSLLGAVFKVLSHDYSSGHQPGGWARYSFIHSKGSRNTVLGMTFDGNGEFTNSTYLPDEVNIHFQPMSFYGESREKRTKNNRAFFNDVLGSGGHSYMWGNSDNAWMCFNYANAHAGSGMAGGNRNTVMIGNIYQDGLDAHLVANTAENVVISGNVTDMNANGGVCDIAGSKTVAFTGNVGYGGTNTGVWVIKSPNSGETYQDVTVTANLLKNNSRYPHRWQGEITAGFREPTEEFSGENLSILSNHLHSVNNGVDLVDNAVVFVGYGTKKTVFANNAIFGTTTLNFPTYQFRGAEDVAVLNNTCWQDRQALAWFEDCKGRIVWKDNVNSRVHPESPQVPTEMVAQDGRIFYSLVRKLEPLQGIIAFEIKMPGGITNDIVELRVTQQGSTGIVHKRLYVEGHELAVPIIHQEDTLAKVGALPPDVVINKEIGKFVITCRNEHPTTALNLSFSIEITTQDDKGSRLVPRFISMVG